MTPHSKLVTGTLAGAVIVVLAGVVWRFGGKTGSSERSMDPAPGTGDVRTVSTERPRGGDAISTPFLREFAASLQAIELKADPLERERMLEALVSGVAPGDLSASVEFLSKNAHSELNRDLQVRLVRRWAGNDPLAAANWVSGHATGAKRQEEINGLAVIWAEKNLTEALAWVRKLPGEPERNAALLALAYEAARSQPMEAFRVAEDLPDDGVRDDLITHTASQWAARNPKEAVAWARKVDDDTLRQKLLVSITTAWADKEPAAAANLAVELLPPGQPQDDAVMGIVQRWVQSEPREAATWVLDFPGGSLQETALEEVVKLWVDQDPAQAGEWIGELKEEHRDIAAAAYAGKIALVSPESALDWAGSIGDETLRTRLMETVAESWMTSDPAAARVWISTADLPETTRIRLLESEEN